MNRFIPGIILLLIFCGCSETREQFKADYLNVTPKMNRKRVQEVKFIAEKELLNSSSSDSYQIDSAKIDEIAAMPETHEYIFVHFDPVSYQPKAKDTTYLVVLSRNEDRLLHSGVFTTPGGDHYYRYAEIIRKFY
jgi:hypothetical protein